MLSTIAAISGISNANLVDIFAIVVLAICTIGDAIRGISTTIGTVASLVASFKLAFMVCPWIQSALVKNTNGTTMSTLLPVAVAIILLVIIFIILRYLLTKFVQVVVQKPIDNILGALAGLIKGALVLFLIFAILKLVLGGSYSSSAFSKSQTGSQLYPVLEKAISTSYRIGVSK